MANDVWAKVHFTNSSRLAARREVELLRFHMTDVDQQPTEAKDKEEETETEANQR